MKKKLTTLLTDLDYWRDVGGWSLGLFTGLTLVLGLGTWVTAFDGEPLQAVLVACLPFGVALLFVTVTRLAEPRSTGEIMTVEEVKERIASVRE